MESADSIRAVFYGTYHWVESNTYFTLCTDIGPRELSMEVKTIKLEDGKYGAYLRIYIFVYQQDEDIDAYATKINKTSFMTIELVWYTIPILIDSIDLLVKRILLIHNILPQEDKKGSHYKMKMRNLVKIYKKQILEKAPESNNKINLESLVDFSTNFIQEVAMRAQEEYDAAETIDIKNAIEYFWGNVISTGARNTFLRDFE